MKMNWDSFKFISKVLALIIVLIAGYVQKNQSKSPAEKGAVDLIINPHHNPMDAGNTVINQKILNV